MQDFYDIIDAGLRQRHAGEKQAPQSGICFSASDAGVNEQTSDEIGQEALKARVCE